MTQGPGQENNAPQQESLLHKAWASLTMALGTPLTITLAVLMGAIIVLVAVALAWYLNPVFAHKKLSVTDRKDLVQGLASVAQAAAVRLTGAVGFIGLVFTWRNLRQTRESSQRTLELTEQGQITERFTRAIDQLGATDDKGNKKLEVRLGGIYALERIAKESPERIYNGIVMEVLTAYVRENSCREESERLSSSSTVPNEEAEQDKGIEQDAYLKLGSSVPADIRAILDVLTRREDEHAPIEAHEFLNLHGANLRGAFFYSPYGADLRGVYLTEADLTGANLSGARAEIAQLQRANLTGANIQATNLRWVTFYKANLQGANLTEANLENAVFEEANLQGANLQGANLSGANLSFALNLTQEQLEGAEGDDTTQLPSHLKPPAHWA